MYTFNIALFRIPLNTKDLNGLTLSVAANGLHRILLLAPRMEITQSSVFVTRNGNILINGKQNLKMTFIYCILTRIIRGMSDREYQRYVSLTCIIFSKRSINREEMVL